MAKNTYTYSGKCRWAKLHRADAKFHPDDPIYSIDLQMDLEQYKTFKDTGVKNNGKFEDGKMWVALRRKSSEGKPTVVDKDGKPTDVDVGNGSDVTVKVAVEDFVSKKFGKVVRCVLEAVRIDNLVVYNPEASQQGADVNKGGQSTAPSGVKPPVLF